MSFTANEMRVDSRIGNTPRTIRLADEQVFITENNDVVDQWLKRSRQHQSNGWLHRVEQNLGLVIVATLITIGLLFFTIKYGLPKAAETIAFNLPSVSAKYAGSSLDVLDRVVFSPSELSVEKQSIIRKVLQPHVAEFDRLSPSIYFRKAKGANAFALMHGEIIFTDAFIELAPSNDEIIAVFFHEVGHLKHKHLLRRVLQDSMLTLLVILLAGDVETTDLLTGLPTLLLDLSYSRHFESEADAFALSALYSASVPVDALSTALTRLANANKKECNDVEGCGKKESSYASHYLRSHPLTEDRLASVARFAASHSPRSRELNEAPQVVNSQ